MPMAPIFDACTLTTVLAILVVPPLTLSWAAAVAAVRFLNDQPIGFRGLIDAMVTGFHLQLLWLITSTLAAIVAGPATTLPFLYLTGELPAEAWSVALAAAVLAVAVMTWKVAWPILGEEWRRLTGGDAAPSENAATAIPHQASTAHPHDRRRSPAGQERTAGPTGD